MKIKKGDTIYRFRSGEDFFETAIAAENSRKRSKTICVISDNCVSVRMEMGWATTKEEAFDLWADFVKESISKIDIKISGLLAEKDQYESELWVLQKIDKNALDELKVE